MTSSSSSSTGVLSNTTTEIISTLCTAPLWPETRPCSGNGQCLLTSSQTWQCVCNPGWSGSAEMWARHGDDCSLYNNYLSSINWIGFAFAIISSLDGLITLYRLRPPGSRYPSLTDVPTRAAICGTIFAIQQVIFFLIRSVSNNSQVVDSPVLAIFTILGCLFFWTYVAQIQWCVSKSA
jgi:hypothetical protein